MRELQPYPAYKDSGVEWIGDIPEDWSVVKLKYLSMVNTGDKDTQDNVANGLYPFFVRSDKVERINEYTHDEEAVMTAGDGVGVGKVFHYYEGKFSAHQRVYLFTNFNNITGKYLYYYLRSNLIFEVKQGTAKSTVDSLRRNMLTNLPISIPNVKQQKRIAEFIDDKASEIELLISDKKHLIELLEEKRQAIITETVTKGLDTNVKMKDSGIEWIGEIPEHWETVKLKFIGDATMGLLYSPTETTYNGQGKLVLRASNIQSSAIDIDRKDNVYVNKEISQSLITQVNDILICARSGSRDLIGKSALIDDKSAGNSFGAFTTIFRSEYNRFVSYVFRSGLFQSQIGTYLTSTINQLTMSNLRNLEIVFPPKEEQKILVEVLKKYDENVNSSIKIIKNQISKLKEYRESLIYEAVTGKIDLRSSNN